MSISGKNDAVWDKAKPICGKDPGKYRQDPYNKEMYYGSCGLDFEKGWEIDHNRSKVHGGSNETVNLQALNTRLNRQKGDSQS